MYERSAQRIKAAQSSFIQHRALLKRPVKSDRRSLLLGTALASTLLMGTLAVPTPAGALTCAGDFGTGPAPISHLNINDAIICVNNEARTNAAGNAIELGTYDADHFISLNSSGALIATDGASPSGIRTTAYGTNSPIDVLNSGDIRATGTIGYAIGVAASTNNSDSPTSIANSGDITARSDATAAGVFGFTRADDSAINIVNSGDLSIDAGQNAIGIQSQAYGASPTTLTNTGKIAVSSGYNAFGIFSQAAINAPISIVNRGNIAAMSDMAYAAGIFASSYTSEVSIVNSGTIGSEGSIQAMGLFAQTAGGPVSIVNSGDLTASAGDNAAVGIFGQTYGSGGSIFVNNGGDISVDSPDRYAGGIVGLTAGDDSSVSITNSGHVNAAHSQLIAAGMYASTRGANSGITITNSGSLSAISQSNAFGILAKAYGPNSPVSIINSGSIYGEKAGVYATTATTTRIVNTGNISAGLGPAISVSAGGVQIQNSGHLAGFVQLDADDTLINEAGGVFEARRTSDFDASGAGGNDLFRNEQGARVHASGMTSFINLERFENQGLIALADGATDDSFTISTKPRGTDLNFVASGNSTLTLDTFLGGARSPTDTLTIQGKVSGVTTVQINNTNTAPGVFNPAGIKVVTVTGTTPIGNEFQLDQPIDTGFLDYDLFFTPTGSGFWSLKSFPDADAHLLPQLVTAAQDIWHQASSTWFDRTADLRVLLNGGAAPTVYNPGGKSASEAPGNFTPAVWARGSGGWLSRDDSASTSAYGRTYDYDLDRDIQTIDFQMGLDLGKRDFLSQGDVLVFGVLGGFVQANLDYDHRVRQFDFDGGQVGAYATYLKGGLFVDSLFNAHLYALDDNGTLGVPRSLDSYTLGVRTDTGYRFGSFSGGPFIEPLATLEVTWAHIDGFSLGDNTVSFDDDANVRGRLGLRAGTTTEVREGTLMEPFVTCSLWGNITDGNSAALVSSGRTLRFEDELDDVWGEVSAGVNFFDFSQTTAVFAKADVTFGDDLSGIGGKVGMRLSW